MTHKLLRTGLLVAVLATVSVFGAKWACQPSHAWCSTKPSFPAQQPVQPVQELARNYYTYSPESLAFGHENNRQVVLYFWAPWCTSCSTLDAELKSTATIPDQIVILRVPYDTAKDLKRQYGITVQHTFVAIDETGQAQATWVGGGLTELLSHLP